MILSRTMRDALEKMAEDMSASMEDLVDAVDAIHAANPLLNEPSILVVLKSTFPCLAVLKSVSP